MGTTADKLQAVLNSKNKIKNKFNLADDLPFSQYAENINAGGTGEATTSEFYKVWRVVPDEEWDYLIITTRGFSDNKVPDYYGYVYVLTDLTAVGTERVWGSVELTPSGALRPSIEPKYLIKFDAESGKWILSGEEMDGGLKEVKEGTDHPWTDDVDNAAGVVVLRSSRMEGFICVYGIGANHSITEEFYRDASLDADGAFGFSSSSGAKLMYSFGTYANSAVIHKDNAFVEHFYEVPGKGEHDGTWISFWAKSTRPKKEDTGRGYGHPIVKNENNEYIVDEAHNVSFFYDRNRMDIIPEVGGIYDGALEISVNHMVKDLYGISGAFYLCSYVNRNYFSYNTIVVSGMPTAPFVGCTYVNEETWETADVPEDIAARDPNGTYTLQNPDEQIYNWYWENENGCVIDHWNMGMGQPIIYPGKDYKNTNKYIYVESMMGEIPQYPVPDDYTSFEWKYSSGSGSDTVVDGGSVSAPKPPEVEKYWEGYKLEADESGKYNLSPDKTKLTYGDYMPVAGRIYDAAATVEITNADLSEDALWSCPRNMTSNESDEWVITASSVYTYDGIGYPWHAFDADNGTESKTDYVQSNWLQWQNKNRAVVVKRIVFYLYDQNDLNTVSYLQGSDDGEHWTDIVRGQVGYPSEKDGTVEYVDGLTKVTRDFKGNAPCYKYWRLGRDSGSNFRLIIHKIEAFSQLPREVPK